MKDHSLTDLGKIIGGAISSANDYKISFLPSEEIADINIVALHSVFLSGSYFVRKQFVGTAFHVDHPVNGRADNGYTYDTVDLGSNVLISSGDL